MVIFAGLTQTGNFDYEYTFNSYQEFNNWIHNWKEIFDTPLEGLMINTFEESNND